MSDDEVICLDDDDDDIPTGCTSNNLTSTTHPVGRKRDNIGQPGSVIKYTGAEGSFEEPVILSDSDDETRGGRSRDVINRRGRRKSYLISSDEELPDLNSNSSGEDAIEFSVNKRRLKEKSKKRIVKSRRTKTAAKIKLPKLLSTSSNKCPESTVPKKSEDVFDLVALTSQSHDPNSPSKKSPKKKKTLADIVTDIHETSTDEIDSDEINASQEKLNCDPSPSKIIQTMYGEQKLDEPQPCCSKSLVPQPITIKNITASRKKHVLISSDDEDLPDIDLEIDFGVNYNKPTFSTQLQPISNGINCGRKNPEYNKPMSKESQSSHSSAGSSSASNSQASVTDRQTKKQQKEVEAERKKQEKEVKRLEKERKKVEETREKELKKVENELRRNSKPGEAFKFMTVVLDNLLANKLDALIPQLVAADIRYESKTGPKIENSITFQRELVHQAMNDNLQIQRVTRTQEEDQLMVVIDSDQTIPMINAQLNRHTIDNQDLGVDLISWVESIKTSCPGKKLTLFLYDMDNFFKKVKKNTQQEFRNRVLNANDDQPQKKKRKNNNKVLPQISKTELQSALIDLQLQTGINYRMVKNVGELGTAVIQYTKAIADAPFKKQRQEDQGFDWFALSDSAGSVRVDKDGSGLRRLWIDQLQQFNNVGLDIATAIANKYPSPRSLIEAYQRCTSEEEGQCLVRDVSVTTGEGPLARKRKVGPELSKKMYRFFTTTNGDRFLGSTSDMR